MTKLYLWTDVLADYTPGVMFALADSADEARELIVAEGLWAEKILRKRESAQDRGRWVAFLEQYIRSELVKEPREIELNSKFAFVLEGGG